MDDSDPQTHRHTPSLRPIKTMYWVGFLNLWLHNTLTRFIIEVNMQCLQCLFYTFLSLETQVIPWTGIKTILSLSPYRQITFIAQGLFPMVLKFLNPFCTRLFVFLIFSSGSCSSNGTLKSALVKNAKKRFPWISKKSKLLSSRAVRENSKP